MMKVRNLGRKSLEEVLAKLKELGLRVESGRGIRSSCFFSFYRFTEERGRSVSPKEHGVIVVAMQCMKCIAHKECIR